MISYSRNTYSWPMLLLYPRLTPFWWWWYWLVYWWRRQGRGSALSLHYFYCLCRGCSSFQRFSIHRYASVVHPKNLCHNKTFLILTEIILWINWLRRSQSLSVKFILSILLPRYEEKQNKITKITILNSCF